MGYSDATYRNISCLIATIGNLSNATGQSCDGPVAVRDIVPAMMADHYMSKPTVYRIIRAAENLQLITGTPNLDLWLDKRHRYIHLTDTGTTDYHAQTRPIPGTPGPKG